MQHIPVLIDPLALLPPTSVYLKLMDQLHPNIPLIDSLRAVKMTAEEKTEMRVNAKRVTEFTRAVESVIG